MSWLQNTKEKNRKVRSFARKEKINKRQIHDVGVIFVAAQKNDKKICVYPPGVLIHTDFIKRYDKERSHNVLRKLHL